MKYPYRQPNGKFGSAIVDNVPSEAAFCDLSQDCENIREYLGDSASEYDTFFVIVEDGDYAAVWGMYNSVPYLGKSVYRLK